MLAATFLQFLFHPDSMRALLRGLFLPVVTVLDVFFQPLLHIYDGGSQVGDRVIPFADGLFQLLQMCALHFRDQTLVLAATFLQFLFHPDSMRAFLCGLLPPVITVLEVFCQPVLHIEDGGSQLGDRAIPFADGFFQLLLMRTLHVGDQTLVLTATFLQFLFHPNPMRALLRGLFLTVITIPDVFFQPVLHIDDHGFQGFRFRAINFAITPCVGYLSVKCDPIKCVKIREEVALRDGRRIRELATDPHFVRLSSLGVREHCRRKIDPIQDRSQLFVEVFAVGDEARELHKD